MLEKLRNIFRRFAAKGVFPHELAFTLLIPLRNIFLSPKQLIQRLELKENYNVLEVGAGPGYFSLGVAGAIPKGKLILADIQEQMLNMARKRLAKKMFNVEYHLCNGIDFPFENACFDVIYMVTVLGEVENKQRYAKEFYRMLRPEGVLSISEQAGDSDKMSMDEIKVLFHSFGFQTYRIYGSRNNFTINFKR